MAPTKRKIAREIASEIGMGYRETSDVITAILRVLLDRLMKERTLTIDGFGELYIRKRATRRYRNPRTGESIISKAGRPVKFAPDGSFAERLEALRKESDWHSQRHPPEVA